MIKKRIKKMGKVLFVNLKQVEGLSFKEPVLVVDNGYVSLQHLGQAVTQIKERLPQGKITLITFPHRREFLKSRFPNVEIVFPGRSLIPRYQIAAQILRMCRTKYDHVVLLSLDITPIIVSLLFMRGKVLLYNRWHQWWRLELRSIFEILFIPIRLLIDILVFLYLILAVSFIFFRRKINVLRLPRKSES